MSETKAQLLQDFLSLVLWRLTLTRCTDVGEFTHYLSVLIAEFPQKLRLLLTSAVTGVAGVPERICSIIQARPSLLRSQALLNFLMQLMEESHLGPDDVTAMDIE